MFAKTAEHLARMPGAERAGMPPQRLAVALQAVALGLTVQSFITPDEVTDAVIRETLAALAAGLERGAAEPR
jgi:hypothetical protein